ncbi:MAG TPA: efflux RND transporter periplasmic adaptor subunit [Chitinophagaceae bacterium]|nr:efflux RND transporter periplasmic adaptor subunit [Chitinophagaceae bacterium]
MKKFKPFAITVIIIAAIAATWFFGFRKKPTVLRLDVEKPQRGYISQSVTSTGTIQPVDTVAVGTQVSGTIKSIYVDFNSVVKKGQLLAELDKTLFVASVNQYKGSLAQAQSQQVYQQGNFDRQSQLYKVGAISKADYDNALYTFQSAKASVASLAAQVATAEKNLSLASIYSPIDGTVLSRNISEGQTVAASFSTPTLFSIAKDLTKMQVRASVDEADIGNITAGERATFTVDAFANDVFKGSIQEIRLSPTVSSNVVTYTTIINTSNDDKKLKPGMTANITIYTKEVDSALLIPARALKFNPDSSLTKQYTLVTDTSKHLRHGFAHIWVKQDEATLVQKKIKTGINDNTHVEVLDGLGENETVVTGAEQLTSKEAAAPAAASPFMPARRNNNTRRR